jgi:hypothetical protein
LLNRRHRLFWQHTTNAEYSLTDAIAANQTIEAATGVSCPALTNSDVLNLKAAGLSDALVIQKIKSSPGHYQLGTDDLLMLNKNGLSDEVIGAMMATPKS